MLAFGCKRQHGGEDKRRQQSDEAGQRFHVFAERAGERQQRQETCEHHRSGADRIGSGQISALEFDPARTETERLVDDEIGRQRADPGHREVGIDRQDRTERVIDAELHDQKRNRHIEDQPDHATGMAVRHAGKEIRPRDRAGIGVGHVDLDLRQRHEQHGGGDDQAIRMKQIAEADAIHFDRLRRILRRQAVTHRDDGQHRSGQHLQRADHDPAGTADQRRAPPAPVEAAAIARRHESEEIRLLADLSHQREDHRCGGAEQHEIECGLHAVDAGKLDPALEIVRRHDRERRERR